MSISLFPGYLNVCSSPEYLNYINITNLDCFTNSTACISSGSNVNSSLAFTGLHITRAVEPGDLSVDKWTYLSSSDNFTPDKPFSIECPMPVCLYSVTGFYSPCQRYLLYGNIMLMFVAGRTPILRGIASIYVFGVYLVSSIVLWGLSIVELRARSTLAFTNMDRYPAQVFFNWGFILFFLWLINRNGVKGTLFIITTRPMMDVEAYMCDPEGIKDKQSLRQSVFMSLGCILFVAYWSMAYVFTVVIYTKSNVLPAVLLFSESEYRIASPCYQDPRSGIATMWGDGTDARHEPFRVLTELVQQIPSVSAKVKLTPGTIHAASAALQKPMPHLPIWACVPIFIAAMVAIPLVYISIEQIWPRVFRRERRWTVFRHCSTLAGIGSGLYVTIPLELGFHNNQTPQAEQFFQVGQWGPWAIGVVILIAAVIYKTLGLDSHDSSRTFVSVSSRRKSSGASEKEERLPLLERLPSNDSTDSSCPTETTLVEAAELSRPCASYQKDSRSIGDDGRGRPSSSSSNHTLRSNSPTESLYGETLELVPTNWSGKTVLDV